MLAGLFVGGVPEAVAQPDPAPQATQPAEPASCQRAELVELRTQSSKTFLNEDCSRTGVFGTLLHYESAPGRWEDVDLRFRPDGSGFVMDRHNLVARVRGATVDITERAGEGVRWLTPVVPEVAERSAQYRSAGLDWTYTTRKTGLKLSAIVDAPRGPQTYEFRYQLLGGASDFTVDDDGNLVSSAFTVPRATVLGADLALREAGPWQLLPGQRVAFDWDDSELPESAYPYELDPTTTFSVNANSDDGTVHGGSTTYPPPSGSQADLGLQHMIAGRTYQSWLNPPQYAVWNSVMRWHTGAIPDTAELTSASLVVNKWYSPIYDTATYNQNGRNLTADWHEVGGITTASYSATAQTNALSGMSLGSFTNYQDYTINLANANGVSKVGYTGLRLHVDGGQPTGMNHVYFTAFDDPTYPEPRLVVNYNLNAAPSITSVSDSPDPLTVGSVGTFTVGWNDPGDSVRAVICKTNSISSTGTCPGGSFATASPSSTSPSTTTWVPSHADVGTRTYYAFVCDASNLCSTATTGSVTVQNRAPAITSASDTPDPLTAGGTVSFSVGWNDPGDTVRAVICKTNSVSSTATCPGGSWATGNLSSSSPSSAAYTTSMSNVGTNTYYAFACDASNACSSSSTGTFTVQNPGPSIISASDLPDPTTVGTTVTFSVAWSDAGDTAKAVICKTNSISAGSCGGGTWASGPLGSTSPSSANYTPVQADIGTNTYYAFACDSGNSCSTSISGTFTVQNRVPSASSHADSPDPVTAGDPVTFSITWSDPGDSVRAVVCKTNAISSGTCPGGSWATGSPTTTGTSSATYTTSHADVGTRNYFIFACDTSNACSSFRSGTFTVHNKQPQLTSASDTPDPVTAGQTLTFNVGWRDPGDSVRAVICRTNAISAGTCSGGAWATGNPQSTSPSQAYYVTSPADAGTKSYFAFACDTTNACSSGQAGTFSVVLASQGPQITNVTPNPAEIGDEITIHGSGFGAETSDTEVVIGDESATVTSWSSNRVVAVVPAGLAAAPQELQVYAADDDSNEAEVTIANQETGETSNAFPGQILIRVAPGVSASLVAGAYGDSVLAPVFTDETDELLARWFVVSVPAGQENSRVEQYAGDPRVEWAELNYAARTNVSPNDTYYDSDQWYLHQSSDVDIDAPETWDIAQGDPSVSVAVIDSGIHDHPDLLGNLGPAELWGTRCPGEAHGTHVGGLASAVTNNSRGVASIGWNTTIRSYGVFDVYDGECMTYEREVVNAIAKASRDGNEVINMSLGFLDHYYSQAAQDATTVAWKKRGTIIVAAAGNEGTDKESYPAANMHTVAVGNVTKAGDRAGDSNYGPWVDVFAPGTNLLSTYTYAGNDHQYAYLSGTSMASPLVAGTAALMVAEQPGVPNSKIVSALKRTAEGGLNVISANRAVRDILQVKEPNGVFVRRKGSKIVWFLDNGVKRKVLSRTMLRSWGIDSRTGSQIAVLTQEQLETIERGDPMGFRPGTLLRPSDDLSTVYVVTNLSPGGVVNWTRGAKRLLAADAQGCLGYDTSKALPVSRKALALHPDGATLTGCTQHASGTALMRPSDQTIWITQANKKRQVRTNQILVSWGWDDEVVSGPLNELELRDMPEDTDIGYRPGRLIRVPGNPVNLVTSNGDFASAQRRRFPQDGYLSCYGLENAPVMTVENQYLTIHPQGSDLTC